MKIVIIMSGTSKLWQWAMDIKILKQLKPNNIFYWSIILYTYTSSIWWWKCVCVCVCTKTGQFTKWKYRIGGNLHNKYKHQHTKYKTQTQHTPTQFHAHGGAYLFRLVAADACLTSFHWLHAGRDGWAAAESGPSECCCGWASVLPAAWRLAERWWRSRLSAWRAGRDAALQRASGCARHACAADERRPCKEGRGPGAKQIILALWWRCGRWRWLRDGCGGCWWYTVTARKGRMCVRVIMYGCVCVCMNCASCRNCVHPKFSTPWLCVCVCDNIFSCLHIHVHASIPHVCRCSIRITLNLSLSLSLSLALYPARQKCYRFNSHL